MLKINPLLKVAAPLIGIFLFSQSVQAQSYNNSIWGTLQQDVAGGLLTPGQASNLASKQNSLAQRAAKLLRNDGGVLTPNDQAKLNRQAAHDNALLNSDVAGNMNGGGGILGGLFGGTPVARPASTGLFGGLFGGTPAYSTAMPYGAAYPAGYGTVMPYNTGVPYGTTVPVTTTPGYSTYNPYHHHHHYNGVNGVSGI